MTERDLHAYVRQSDEMAMKTQFSQGELNGRLVLDAGCGSGRIMDVLCSSLWMSMKLRR